MAVGEAKGSPRKLGGIPDFGNIRPVRPSEGGERINRPVETPALPGDAYVRTRPDVRGQGQEPAAPAAEPGQQTPAQPGAQPDPAQQIDPAQVRFWHRVGVSVGAGIGTLFNYGFIRKASSLIAAGKPVGVFLGKIAPALGIAFGSYGLYGKLTKEWGKPGNDRKWDDLIRMAGDAMQVGGGIAAFVPAIGLVPGLTTAAIGTVVSWVGEMFNDAVGK